VTFYGHPDKLLSATSLTAQK